MTRCGEAPAEFNAIVLAGGAARRLGGASKPDVEIAGRRLLDYALDATRNAHRTVVVGPPGLSVPAGVELTLEDPPLGGPVAGIAAGLAALYPGPIADDAAPALVLILACDVPGAASAVPRLVDAMSPGSARHAGKETPKGNVDDHVDDDVDGVDGACLVDDEGHLQWLVGLYRLPALRTGFSRLETGGGVRNAGVRSLLARMHLVQVPARDGEAGDVDTWRDVESQTRRAKTDDVGINTELPVLRCLKPVDREE